MSKIDNNKQQKRDSLLESAFSLFINNGCFISIIEQEL